MLHSLLTQPKVAASGSSSSEPRPGDDDVVVVQDPAKMINIDKKKKAAQRSDSWSHNDNNNGDSSRSSNAKGSRKRFLSLSKSFASSLKGGGRTSRRLPPMAEWKANIIAQASSSSKTLVVLCVFVFPIERAPFVSFVIYHVNFTASTFGRWFGEKFNVLVFLTACRRSNTYSIMAGAIKPVFIVVYAIRSDKRSFPSAVSQTERQLGGMRNNLTYVYLAV